MELFGIICLIIAGALFGFKKWGEANEKKKQAERAAKEMARDAEIASRPNVPDPLDRMS